MTVVVVFHGQLSQIILFEYEKVIYGHFHSVKLLRCVNLCVGTRKV